MIAFIDDCRDVYGVEPICRVLPIAPSTCHEADARRRRPERRPPRIRRDEALKLEILRVFNENFTVYGANKVWHQMRREGFDIARCTVRRLMKAIELKGFIRGKPHRTTYSDKAAPCPLDHVNSNFKAPAPNRLWVSDFTYVSTWSGPVYVAFVIDVFARRIVGWRVSRTAYASFVLDAFEQALHDRRPASEVVLFITLIAAVRMSVYGICNVWQKQAFNHPSAVSVTATTTPSPKPSMDSTRPKSSGAKAHGNPWTQSNTPRLNGSTGSTTAACSSRSETSRRQKPRPTTLQR